MFEKNLPEGVTPDRVVELMFESDPEEIVSFVSTYKVFDSNLGPERQDRLSKINVFVTSPSQISVHATHGSTLAPEVEPYVDEKIEEAEREGEDDGSPLPT